VQFRYSRFTPEDYTRDQMLMRAVDQAPWVTFGQFRILAKRQGWTVVSLVAFVKGELDEPQRTLEHILKTGAAETVIAYTCLIELYQMATAKPVEVNPGYCACGRSSCVLGRQRYGTSACRSRAHQHRVA
jgi:hypothetical protein